MLRINKFGGQDGMERVSKIFSSTTPVIGNRSPKSMVCSTLSRAVWKVRSMPGALTSKLPVQETSDNWLLRATSRLLQVVK
jgi:hypothetical protein